MTGMEAAEREYARWLSSELLGEPLRRELLGIGGDKEAVFDRFSRPLAFGTGGLRGILGAGTNRMNTYTAARATKGLADYLGGESSVVIAYDTRRLSREFAETAAGVLLARGIRVWLFSSPHPTPMLSFAVREKKASAGIVITASHNPREYNGYKVYGADGGQITDAAAKAVAERMARYDPLEPLPPVSLEQAEKEGMLSDPGDADAAYYEQVWSLAVRKRMIADRACQLSILYTPLHGTGGRPVCRALRGLGFQSLSTVPEQQAPDGDFPTIRYPNPEEPSAFDLALRQAGHLKPDIILATDPDCDRIGVMARGAGGYLPFSGNQIGALLTDYLIAAKRETGADMRQAAVIKTIVTTDLAHTVARQNGVAVLDTLTGFKYIGEQIGRIEKTGEYRFLFGFEESCGYLAGDFVRDKDAVIAAVLIAEMALYYKTEGLSLPDALEALYRRYGYADDRLCSVELAGSDGSRKIKEIMRALRTGGVKLPASLGLWRTEDYLEGRAFDRESGRTTPLSLPKSDVLKFHLTGGWLAVRPSGTEPKIKFYFGANGEKAAVIRRMREIERLVRSWL